MKKTTLRNSIGRIMLVGLAFVPATPVDAAMYCDGMGVLAELSAKMRDKGLSEKQTLTELRKMSPARTVNSDITDLVHAAYMDMGRNMSPAQFRSFFESFCRSNGFDRPL